MSNQPVYRSRPRSHAYSCRCPRCVQFMNRPSASGSGAFWGVVALMVLYGMPAAIWHQGTGMVIACAIWWPVLTAVTVLIAYGSYLEKQPKARTPRPPRGPLPVEALRPPPPSVVARPVCLHLNAEPVDNMLDPDAPPWAWLCPECNAQLPAEFGLLRRSCCGTAHGMFHRHNCPRRPPAAL